MYNHCSHLHLGSDNMVALLLRNGANVNLTYSFNGIDETIVNFATGRGKLKWEHA